MADEVEVGSLVAKLRVDLSSLQADVRRMESTFNSGFGNIQSRAIIAGRNIAASLGLTLGVGSFAAFIKGTIQAADAITDLSDSSGLSVKTLLGLQQVTAKYGITVQEAATGVRFMLRALNEAQDGSGKQAEALERLGFTTQETLKFMSDPDGFLKEFATRLAAIPTHAERVAIAQDLASRAGGRLAPVLLDIAKNGLPAVNDETVKAYQELGKLADALAVATVKFGQWLTALTVRIVKGPSEVERMQAALKEFQRQLDQMQKPDDAIITWLEKLVGRDRGKEIEKLQEKLRGLRDALDEMEAPKFEPPEAAPEPREDPKKIEALTRSLQGQVIGLKAQKIELDQGASAGLRYKLTQDAILEVGQKLPPSVHALINEIVSLTKAFDQLKVSQQILASFAPVFAEIDEKQAKAIESGQEFADIQRQLAHEVLDPLNKELAESDQKFDSLRGRLVAAAEAAGKTEEEIAPLEQRIRSLRAVEAIKISVDREDLDKIIQKKEADDFGKSLGEVQARMQDLREVAIALADPFATFSSQMSVAREKVELLTKEFGALDPRVKEAVAELNQLTAVEKMRTDFREITDSLTNGIKETVIGIQRGEQTLSEGLKNMFRNALIGLNVAILNKGIFEPIKGMLNAFFDGFAQEFAKGANKASEDMARSLGASLGGALRNVLSNLNIGGAGGGGGGFSFDLSGVFGWIKGLFGFEKGGIVPAFLHEGEFVMRRSAVDAIGPDVLGKMNRDLRLPRFQFGGYVNSAFAIPHFQSGGFVANQSQTAMNNRPLIVELIQDFTGAVAPSDMKTGKREVKQFMVDMMQHDHDMRVQLREATRK